MTGLDELLAFIREDAPSGDLTSDAVIPDVQCSAAIRAERDGVLAGMDEAVLLFTYFGVEVTSRMQDGDPLKPGNVVLAVNGPAKKILLVERTALNILGRMSGIATRTSRMVAIVKGRNPSCRVAGTRKTCPGFRRFDKRAVQIGGGDPHRTTLSDGILIKDNHLVLVPLAEALRAARAYSAYLKIEVEVESTADAVKAARGGADIVMLDNMTLPQVRETLDLLEKSGLRDHVTIEVSGGIDESTLGDYAACGVDVISMGALTHTVNNLSFGLEIRPPGLHDRE